MQLIRDGVVDDVGVAGLASRLSVSERHLHRILLARVGASPQQLNRTRRAHAARTLIEQTSLSLADVAFAAGFGSVRQFNEAMRAEFGVTPSTYRRPKGLASSTDGTTSDQAPAIVLHLRHRPPLETEPLRRFLAAHAVAGLDVIDDEAGEHTHLIPADHGPAAVTVVWGKSAQHVVVRLQLADLSDLMAVVGKVRRWLDLDAEPDIINEVLTADSVLTPLVAARPGLRLPGSVDGAATALSCVLGQQVSLKAAATFSGRLVKAYGTRISDALTAFPSPAVLASTDMEQLRASIGITQARVRALQALAQALDDGLRLAPGEDSAVVRAKLLSLPGIGSWTADYIALRCLGDPNALPAGDLILKRALGVTSASAVLQRSTNWPPWRGYAAMHLWTDDVFS